MLPTPYYDVDGITIYHGDCREILPHLPKVDLVLTDPPYGIGYKYASYNDTIESHADLVGNSIGLCRDKAKTVAVFAGVGTMFNLPKPDWTFCWFSPSRPNRCPYGFSTWTPILVWGKDKRVNGGALPDGVQIRAIDTAKYGHPCSKPTKIMAWFVQRFSDNNNLILDPFMGSGTTLVAAKQLGRKAIGIEIEEKYCQIAVKRLSQGVLPL